jgi:hypothetical protein
MTNVQYCQAEIELINWMQLMQERENGNVGVILTQSEREDSEDDNFDDQLIKTHSTERDKALEEYQIYCNLCKKQRNGPQLYLGVTIKLGHQTMSRPMEMGKVGTCGDDICSFPPFVQCNLADFIGDKGRFDLVGFRGNASQLYSNWLFALRLFEPMKWVVNVFQYGWICVLAKAHTFECKELQMPVGIEVQDAKRLH